MIDEIDVLTAVHQKPDENQKEPYSGNSPGSALGTLQTIVLVLLAAFLVRSFIAQPFVVQGRSMKPTLSHQDYLVVDKVKYRLNDPVRGDIVVFKAPEDLTQNYIKRIVGLPGETITIEDSSVRINDQPLDEAYLPQSLTDATNDGSFFLEQTLGEHEYFVLGDNRKHSSDSRRWGPLPEDNIVGRALVTVFPFADFGIITAPGYTPTQ